MNVQAGIDAKDFAIGVLSMTAVVMLAALVVLGTRPAPALADGMTVSGGDYVMTVGALDVTDEDYVYVLDVPMERLIAYRFNVARNLIEIAHGFELAEIRDAATGNDPRPPAPKSPPGRRGRP